VSTLLLSVLLSIGLGANHPTYGTHHRYPNVNALDVSLFHVSGAELLYHRDKALEMHQRFGWDGEISLKRANEQSRRFIIWDRLFQLRNRPHMSVEHKLDYLNELYEKLGERDYFSGMLPGSVCEE
jgi:hypothetical protein